MSTVQVKVSDATFREAMDVLDPAQLRRALFQTVSRTTREGRTDVRREVREKSRAPRKYVDKAISTHLEIRDPEPPIGTIHIRHEGIPAIEFKPNFRGKGGVSVRFSKGGTPVMFRHGFMARMKSGHEGVFIRKRLPVFNSKTDVHDLVKAGFPEHEAKQIFAREGGPQEQFGRGIRYQKRLSVGGNFPRVNAKGIAWRLPIKELKGPSIVATVELADVFKRIESSLAGRLEKNLRSQIDRFTK